MPRLNKTIAFTLLFLILLNEGFGIACSGVKNFQEQYTELKEMETQLQASSPEEINSLKEMKDGTIMEIDGTELKKIAKSVPIIIQLETEIEKRGKIYYALADKDNYFSTDQYVGITIFNWVGEGGKTVLDGVKANYIAENCSEWKTKKDVMEVDLINYTGEKKIKASTILAVPQNSYFALLCAPANVNITAYYFDGTKQTYNLEKGILNGGKQLMVPIGKYSKSNAYSFSGEQGFIDRIIKEVEKENTCIEEGNGKKLVKWNFSNLPEKLLSEEAVEETTPTEEKNSAPQLNNVFFKSTETHLECWAEAWDSDLDKMTYTFTWKRDGEKIFKGSYPEEGDEKKYRSYSTRVKKGQLRAGSTYECIVEVSDGIKSKQLSVKKTIPGEPEPEPEKEEEKPVEGEKKEQEEPKEEKECKKPEDCTETKCGENKHIECIENKCECVENPPEEKEEEQEENGEKEEEKENQPPKLIDVYLKPLNPTPQDTLECIAEAKDPDNETLTYNFTWELNGEKFSEKTYQRKANKMTEKINKKYLKGGQEYKCSATVSDGEYTTKPKSDTTKIIQEKSIDEGKGEEKDSDDDKVPDGSDNCPNQKGPAINHGCPAEEGSPCNGPTDCEGMDCSQANCYPIEKECIKGKCTCCPPKKEKKEPPTPIAKGTEATFIGLPIGWVGSQQSFESEVDRHLGFFFEKAGLEKCRENYEIIKLKIRDVEKEPACNSLKRSGGGIIFGDLIPDRSIYACINKLLGSKAQVNSDISLIAGATNGDLTTTVHGRGVTGLQKNKNIIMFEAQSGVMSLSHEIGHAVGNFCEQYNMYDYRWQNKLFKQRRGEGCQNYYPGHFDTKYTSAYGELPYQFWTDGKYPKCYENEELPCPHLFRYRPPNWERKTAGKGPHKICYSMNPCPGKGFGLGAPRTAQDCLGRLIYDEQGNQKGFDMMGPSQGMLPGLVNKYNMKHGTNFKTERYFDCYEREVFEEKWGC